MEYDNMNILDRRTNKIAKELLEIIMKMESVSYDKIQRV